MKAVKILVISVVILVILLLGAAVSIPFLYKDKILDMAKTESAKFLNAKLDFNNDIDITLFKSFPDVTISVKDFRIVNNAPFQGDTLLNLGKFSITLDIMSVINRGQYKILDISLINPKINIFVTKNGLANWDIAIPDSTKKEEKPSEPTKFKLALKKFSIEGAYIYYNDTQSNMFAQIENFNHNLIGDFSDKKFDITMANTIEKLSYSMGGMPYLKKVKTVFDATINIDNTTSSYTFKDNKLSLNDFIIKMEGNIKMPENAPMDLDLKISSPQTEFKNIISLIPALYYKDFKSLKTSGKVAFGADIKGKYDSTTLPAFNAYLKIDNGYFQYPDLPQSVKDVLVDVSIQNPNGQPDATVINLNAFSMNMAGNILQAKMLIKTPISNLFVDGNIKGTLDFTSIEKFVKLEDMKISGLLKSDISISGYPLTVAQQQFDKFSANGSMKVTDMKYSTKDLPESVSISNAELIFNPKDVNLNNLNMLIGKNDIQANGSLNNLIGYIFKKNEVLKGTLTLTSNYFDVNPYLPKEENPEANKTNPQTTEPSATEPFQLPDNIDFVMKSTLKEVIYSNMNMKNVRGIIHLHNQTIDFKETGLEMLGGSMQADGSYNTQNKMAHTMDMKLKVNTISIPESYKTFMTIQKFANVAQYILGNVSATLNINTVLGADMTPDFNSLFVDGTFALLNAKVNNHPVMAQIADKVKNDKLRSLELKDLKGAFEIKEGKFTLKEPIKINYQTLKAEITGFSGLDQTLNYVMAMEMPTADISKQGATEVNNLLAKNNLSLESAKTLKLNALIGGTVTKPTVKLDLKSATSNIANELKDKLKAEANKKLDEAKAKANTELDKQKQRLDEEKAKKEAEVKAKIDAEKKRLEEEKRKQEEELKRKANEEKEKLKDKGKEKLKDIFKR